MASINDLKTTSGYTGNGTASGEPLELSNPNIKKSNVQQLPMDVDLSADTLNIANPNLQRQRRKKVQPAATSRTIADLSSLPKAPDESLGVDQKKSIEDDIFKPGGPFDQSLEQKRKEMLEINDMIDQHNAMVAAERGEEVPSDEELREIGSADLTPVLKGTKYYDQADAFGRANGAIKKSPIEDKAEKEGRDPFNESHEMEEEVMSMHTDTFDSEEDEDEMEREIKRELENEFNESAENSTPVEILADDDRRYEADADDLSVESDNVPEEYNEKVETEAEEEPVDNVEPEADMEEEAAPEVIDEEEEPVKEEVEKPAPKQKAQTRTPVKKEVTKSSIEEAIDDPNVGVGTDFKVDDSDFDDIDLEDTDETVRDSEVIETVNEEENMKQFQESVTQKIKPVSNKLDLSSFTLIKQPISISATSLGENKLAASMNWGLPNSNQHIAMREFTGKEIEQLGDNTGTNRFQAMKNRYNILYEHVVSDKPNTLEAWLKTISYADNDHIFFTVYGANFAGSNYVPYDCEKCKNTFLSENIDIMDMCKFKDDESKERFEKLRNNTSTAKPGLYLSEVIQLTDKIAIGFRDPSIWSVVFETALLDDNFQRKYRDIIAILAYIDKIYYLDPAARTMREINYKIDQNNAVKTIKAKIITYAKILSTLSPDQYYIILSYINAINARRDDITYIRPEATCSNCHEVIPERVTTAEELVFTRAQLTTLSLTSIN